MTIDNATYRVHLVVCAEHTRGAEPSWDSVAAAIAKDISGIELACTVNLPHGRFESGHFVVVAAEVDAAIEEDVS